MSFQLQALGFKRVIAFSIDYVVMVLWGVVLYGFVMWVTQGAPEKPDSLLTMQLIGFTTMTLPVIIYFTVCEISSWNSSLGKKLMGLQLRSMNGNPLTLRPLIVRNIIKFTPWEVGHLVGNLYQYSENSISYGLYSLSVLSLMLPIYWLYTVLFNDQSVYDRAGAIKVELTSR